MVFYLKYRPQKFNELDIKIAQERLVNIFSSGKIPHAFLFCGPKGTGKTSAARIVAKAVNCERSTSEESKLTSEVSETRAKETPRMVAPLKRGLLRGGGIGKRNSFEPCNRCGSCKAITAGTNLDVLEIDGASNRGIDEIRDLREKIKLAPASAKYKVYIIDEVHMLTQEAFNALLKTLEEPPKHAIFILATTRVDKLPETITSRCLRIDFKKAANDEIVRSLGRIVQGEKLEVKEEALEFIARSSDGSFREGAKILEEASLMGKITLTGVKKLLGKDKDFAQADLLDWLVMKDARKALRWLNDAGEKGADFRVLTQDLLEELHGILMGRFGVGEVVIKQSSNQAIKQLSTEDLKQLIVLFFQAYQELKTAVIPSLPLELAIIEWCEKKRKVQNAKRKATT